MTVALDIETRKSGEGWFRRAEGWLDERGKPAWIVAMVLGFILFWPIGLALLFYMIFGKHALPTGLKSSRFRLSGSWQATPVSKPPRSTTSP